MQTLSLYLEAKIINPFFLSCVPKQNLLTVTSIVFIHCHFLTTLNSEVLILFLYLPCICVWLFIRKRLFNYSKKNINLKSSKCTWKYLFYVVDYMILWKFSLKNKIGIELGITTGKMKYSNVTIKSLNAVRIQ